MKEYLRYQIKRGVYMEIISKIKSWAAALADVGVSLIRSRHCS